MARAGKIVGIVSRANILQALASATKKLPSLASEGDAELRRKVIARLAAEKPAPDHAYRHRSGRQRRSVGARASARLAFDHSKWRGQASNIEFRALTKTT